ncbi:MAG: zinc ABC transporter substrate-binding protein [Gammaproteobacteria bacterium]|nr:zinc ABC transporter substrate-binding protein [Gammaproteobacteria bacterium]
MFSENDKLFPAIRAKIRSEVGKASSLWQIRLSRVVAVVAIALSAAFLTGNASAAPLRVVATTGMVADLVSEVGGPHVTVQTLAKSGVDPHLYKLTRVDLNALLRSDVVFFSGLALEGKMFDSLDRIRKSGKPVIGIADSLPAEHLLALPGDYQYDPHAWMDVALWSLGVSTVLETLSAQLPQHASELEQRAANYQSQLKLLDSRIRTAIQTIPEHRRVLVTAHDAFGYFGRAYGIDVIGVQGVSTESEAGLRRIETLVNTLVAQQVPTVFVESSVSARNVKALIAGAAAQNHVVTIGGQLYSDAMGKAGTWEGTYPGMLEHNASVIASSLGGKPLSESLKSNTNE